MTFRFGLVVTDMAEAALRNADYRRVFAVLDRCEDVRTVPEFRTRIVDAMTTVFAIRTAACFVGESFDSQFSDPDANSSEPIGWERKRAIYRTHWARHDVFTSPEARRRLETTRVASLRDLNTVPAECAVYVRDYLGTWDIRSANAMHLDLPGRGHALVGLFDRNENALDAHDLTAMRLLAKQLSVLTRHLEPQDRTDILAPLTPRQRDVAGLVAHGMSNAAIAHHLTLTEDTVKKYVSRILAATGCETRTRLALEIERTRHHSDLPGRGA